MEKLPQEFLDNMESLLGEEYPQFREGLNGQSWQGLRVNTLRLEVEEFLKLSPWPLQPVAWCSTGFYYFEPARPGRHVFHDAGLYYIQEPSAMAVAEYLRPEPGEWVLDLAAAPGGKSTHLAALMGGEGLIIANEVHRGRAQILSQNMERLGVANAIVTNEAPERLAMHFPEAFDRVLLDAPCSGEGMFRKNPEARREWSSAHVQSCAVRQLSILETVPRLLRPGGRLVYSTCTFSPEENEGVIWRFLQRFPEFSLEEVCLTGGMAPGQPEWVGGPGELARTIRLWPHKARGEGHFIAVLRRKGTAQLRRPSRGNERGRAYGDFREHLSGIVHTPPQGQPVAFGGQLYLVPQAAPSLDGLKAMRPGLHVGTLKKNRFEPAHALSHTLRAEDAVYSIDFSCDAPELSRFLRGETLPCDGPDGWYLVSVAGFGLGWAKQVKGTLKNHLPKGLRQFTS
ncbi:MAG TPA: NOL1/NOP2/sun family putative RNA methylase [Firmicutes bacterium]|jgi:NOL1/NOP2/sun family putative RNA methylase|nr:NOL1/NOP2/sun family putative RNA methylase [Bacillota bacterium]